MPLDVQRLRDSDLMLEAPEAIIAALHLWMAAWHQVPAASLPDDDRSLARYAGYGRSLAAWREVRDAALRGWVHCSDGRLYHRTLAEKANAAWDKRLAYEWGKAKDRHRKAEKDLPPAERTEFPEFDDWKAGRPAPEPASKRQGDLPLESRGNSGGTDSEPRAPASKARAHGGAQDVPTALSSGKSDDFQRNGVQIPPENALKGREGKGSIESTQPTIVEPGVGSVEVSPDDDRPDPLPPGADLMDKFTACCDASGYRPVSPGRIASAMDLVKDWEGRGLDFDTLVLPTIRNVVADMDKPARGLWHFRDAIDHEAAKQKARKGRGRRYDAPTSPIIEVEGEPPVMVEIRKAILERLGPTVYCRALNEVRLVDLRDDSNRLPLQVEGRPDLVEALRFGNYASVLRNAAAPHGFKEVW